MPTRDEYRIERSDGEYGTFFAMLASCIMYMLPLFTEKLWSGRCTMIRSLLYTSDGRIQIDLDRDGWKAALQDPGSLLWVDFEGTPPENDEPLLREVFDFHPLAIDDALQESHVPKIDDWGRYLYIVLHAPVVERRNRIWLETLEVDFFLGENYLVTHHDQRIEALERVWEVIQQDERHLKNGMDHVMYRLADEIAASFMPAVETLDDEIDLAEDQIFGRPNNATLEHILHLKRAALHLRRIIGPQREVLNKLARDDYPLIDEQAQVYFRDVYDHLVRLYDICESLRDLISGSLDTYLSVINNRMNEIMKTFTLITTLFMPISFVVGFFGMNFFQPSVGELQILTSSPVFYGTILVLLLLPWVMWLWMRRRGWM